MSTYGSADLRIEVLNNRNGSYIKKDTLFNNLHDFWTRFHDAKGGIRMFWVVSTCFMETQNEHKEEMDSKFTKSEHYF